MKLSLNDILLKKIINTSNKLIIIDFWAEWCSPCKILNYTIKEIKNIFKKKIKIIKININFNQYTVEKFTIKNIPTIVIIKNKIIITKKNGIISKEYLKNIIKKNLNEKK